MYGRQAAEQYLAGRLSYEYSQAYLKQYDAEIARMNKRMPHSDDKQLLAKRRSKLRFGCWCCANKSSRARRQDRLIVFARLAEMAKSTGTIDDADSFLTLPMPFIASWIQRIESAVKCASADGMEASLFTVPLPHEKPPTHRLQCVGG